VTGARVSWRSGDSRVRRLCGSSWARACPVAQRGHATGLTVLELMFALAIAATLTAIALPLGGNAVDEMRTAAAARYVAGEVMFARMDAIKRSRAVGLRFQPWDGDYLYAMFVDGNANGIRTTDIEQGADPPLLAAGRLGDRFPNVRLELMPDVPDIDGNTGGTLDGVRIGSARILTLSPDGTSSSGTLYVRGQNAQYAVRVFGVTGRTRVLQYRRGQAAWVSR
jgi:type II secretory pathway pseudopilin PulG